MRWVDTERQGARKRPSHRRCRRCCCCIRLWIIRQRVKKTPRLLTAFSPGWEVAIMHSVSVIFVFLFHSVCIAKLRWILLKLEYLFRSHLSSIVGFTDSLALSPGVRRLSPCATKSASVRECYRQRINVKISMRNELRHGQTRHQCQNCLKCDNEIARVS